MAPETFRMRMTFWGVRGSTPTPVAENLGFGGNTTCLEICGRSGERIVVDAGTGIRALGQRMAAEDGTKDVNLFFTHFHWDHIQGIPFFAPLYEPGRKITFHSFAPAQEMRSRLEVQMSYPYFTLDFKETESRREYVRVEDPIRFGDLSLSSFPLNHPQGAYGYRIESGDAAIVVATDFEHGNPVLDRVLRQHAEGADLLIYDAQYTPAEYANRAGWGHSTYLEAARVALDARVKKLVLFHHDPQHDDATMREISKKATALFGNTIAARENQSILI